MSGKNVISINGRLYDAISGMPLPSTAHAAAPPRPHRAHPAIERAPATHKKAHSPQKSTTLRRDAVARPVGQHAATITRDHHQPHIVPKSPAITKFAERTPLSHKSAMQDISPIRKPAAPQLRAARPHDIAAPSSATAPAAIAAMASSPATSPAVSLKKESVLAEAVAKADTHKAAAHKPRKHRTAPKAVSIIAITTAIAIFTGYMTYLTMPGISMRIAASQAGVAATYPEFQPSGYSFDGPITFAAGEVTAQFASNSDDTFYSIKQRKSSWDSQAVLDNYVAKQSSRYVTLVENGITVYTFDNKAAWVNGGILYTLGGNARLSNDQVMKIATSM